MNTRQSNTLVVYGHVGFDVSTIAGRVTRTLGGAAYYAAMAAVTQGADVRLVSMLGTDFPQEALRCSRLDSSACIRGHGPSAIFTQTYDDQNEVIDFDGKLNVCADINPELIPLRPDVPSVILLTTAPPSQQASALEWLKARKYGGLIAIDTTLAYVSEFSNLLQRNDFSIGVLFVNAAEYEALAQRPPFCRRIIVKRGRQGASLFENGIWSEVPAPVVKQICTTTGAGDVFAGAFLAAHLNGSSSAEAMACAVAFATCYVEEGAGCFYQNSTTDAAQPGVTTGVTE